MTPKQAMKQTNNIRRTVDAADVFLKELDSWKGDGLKKYCLGDEAGPGDDWGWYSYHVYYAVRISEGHYDHIDFNVTIDSKTVDVSCEDCSEEFTRIFRKSFKWSVVFEWMDDQVRECIDLFQKKGTVRNNKREECPTCAGRGTVATERPRGLRRK